MGVTVYQKLVRDNIPEIIEKTGAKAVIRRLSEQEYQAALNRKLLEEANEYLEAEDVEELADILEVIHSVLALKGMEFSVLEDIRLRKRLRSGGFEKRVFLESVSAG